MQNHQNSPRNRRMHAGIFAIVGVLALGLPGTGAAQQRLPPPKLLDLSWLIDAVFICADRLTTCSAAFECCDACAERENGAYCGLDLLPAGDPDVRYTCADGQTIATAFCSQGCEDGRCLDPGGGVMVPTL